MGPEAERNLVLTGFMGTGKTTVGRILAERLGCGFVDTDEVIESRAGPIPGIFERDGEEAFREMERSVARELAGRTGLVIATGGRMMLDGECAACLEPGADVICLTASADTIIERIGDTSLRGRADRRANPVHTGEAVARAARERSEQERETPRSDATGRHLSALPLRPLLAGPDVSERVRELLAGRAEGYGRFASVDTEGRSAEEVAAAVMSLLGL